MGLSAPSTSKARGASPLKSLASLGFAVWSSATISGVEQPPTGKATTRRRVPRSSPLSLSLRP